MKIQAPIITIAIVIIIIGLVGAASSKRICYKTRERNGVRPFCLFSVICMCIIFYPQTPEPEAPYGD